MSDLKNIYVIFSKQEFLLREAIDRLKKKLSENETLDYYEFDSQNNIEEVINTAQVNSLNLSKKIVVYHNVDKLNKKNKEVIESYLKKPNEYTILVLTTEKKDSKNKIIQKAIKDKYFYEYRVPRGSLLDEWVTKRVKSYGGKINRDAAQYLIQVAGENLRQLDNETKKLTIYAKDKEISVKDVENVAADTKESTIFNLVDAIGRQDGDSAIVMLDKIINDGEPPLKIFHMVHRQFRLIFETKILIDSGSSPNRIAGELKIPFFTVSKYQEQSRNFSDTALKKIFKLLSQTDYRLKTGGDQSLTLERMVAQCIKI